MGPEGRADQLRRARLDRALGAEHAGEGSFWKKFGFELFGTPEAMAKAAAEGKALYNVENQPIRRIGRPEDIGYVAMFLASERAAMITGQLVSVSGGSFMF